MVTPRVRSGPMFDWVIVAVFLVATVTVAALIVGEMTSIGTAPVPRPAGTAPARPAAVPAGSVSVPVLLLNDGREVRVGDTLAAVTARLGRGEDVDAGAGEGSFGPRLSRAYEAGGSRFVLVLEPFERGGEPRVAAIYMR